jgi:predicted dehydrogenase
VRSVQSLTPPSSQVSHISVLNNLFDHYKITYLCDASPQALQHCSRKVAGGVSKTTSNPTELITSPDVDVVLICNANAFHPSHAILALEHNKYALVEKPLALNYRDIDAIIAAEKKSQAKVFVAYQRRYAEAFLDAVKEVGGMGKIQYARIRGMLSAVYLGIKAD